MTFTIGGVDVLPYVEWDNFTIASSPQYDTSDSFTALDGSEQGEVCTGTVISISATLREIPTETAQELSAVFESETFAVTYSDPISKTATFKRPELSAVCSFEADGTEYWDYTINMTSKPVPYTSGTGGL